MIIALVFISSKQLGSVNRSVCYMIFPSFQNFFVLFQNLNFFAGLQANMYFGKPIGEENIASYYKKVYTGVSTI